MGLLSTGRTLPCQCLLCSPLPADDVQLRQEIIQQLTPHAEVHAAPPTLGLNEVKLIIELISDSVGIIANAAAIATFILLLKDRRQQHREPSRVQIARLGEPGAPLEEVDEATVRRLVGLDTRQEEQR